MNAKLLIGALAFLAIAIPAAAMGGSMIANDAPSLPLDPFPDDAPFDVSLTWNVLAGGPEGDHAALDDDGSLHLTECTLDAADDLDVGGDEGHDPDFLEDSEGHVDACDVSQG